MKRCTFDRLILPFLLRMWYIHIKEKEKDYCHSLQEAGSQLGTLDKGPIGSYGGFILRKN